jgi:hypothetical protein
MGDFRGGLLPEANFAMTDISIKSMNYLQRLLLLNDHANHCNLSTVCTSGTEITLHALFSSPLHIQPSVAGQESSKLLKDIIFLREQLAEE